MHGKATLILTDKDTGRVVERIEEHNMVTNALNSIFSLPPLLAYFNSSRYIFNGFLPMYEHVLKGLVLFSENIPENAYDYMLGGKYSVLATAGDEYSGPDAMRGSFNSNQSCQIENGYRFVWDFAPEKAVGTIKCLSLTNRILGNRGNLALGGANSAYMINPSDLADGGYNSNVPILFNCMGNFFLSKRNGAFYSYLQGNSYIQINRYRISNPLELKICDTTSGVLESETQIDLGFPSNSSYSNISYDPKSERLYVVNYLAEMVNDVYYFKLRYTGINPVTCEKEIETDFITTNVPFYSSTKIAVYNGEIYIFASDRRINVCTFSGTIERTIDIGMSEFFGFMIFEGKLAADCKLTASGRRCLYVFDESKTLITQHANAFTPIASDELNAPYCFSTYTGSVYLQMRTDYLATINNLATPLEKTDQHALQVRYEITN